MADGQAVVIDRADIGDLAVEEKQVSGDERTVIQVEHSAAISARPVVAGEESVEAVLREIMVKRATNRTRPIWT